MSNSWSVISLVDGQREVPLKGCFPTKEAGAERLLERLNVRHELVPCASRVGPNGLCETYLVRLQGASSSDRENVFGMVVRMNQLDAFHAALAACDNALYAPKLNLEDGDSVMGVEYVRNICLYLHEPPQIYSMLLFDGCLSRSSSLSNRPQAISAAATLTVFAREYGGLWAGGRICRSCVASQPSQH